MRASFAALAPVDSSDTYAVYSQFQVSLANLPMAAPRKASGLVVVGAHERDLAGRLDDVDGDRRHVAVRLADLR